MSLERTRQRYRSGVTRRDLIPACGALWLASCGDESPTEGNSGSGLTCGDGEIEAMADELLMTDRARILEVATGYLSAGRSIADVSHAAFFAGIRASSFTEHSNHPVKAVESAKQLAMHASGPDRYVPLLWAVDTTSSYPDGIVNPRDTGEPAPPLDESAVPSSDKALAAFDGAMMEYDAERAQGAIVALARGPGIEAVTESLCYWAQRNIIPNGHWAIAAAQYLRILEAHGWRCGELPLRHVVFSLAGDPRDTGWGNGELNFWANHDRAAEIPESWVDNAIDDSGALELLAKLRTPSEGEASDAAAQLLADGLGAQSIWDGVFLRAAEAGLYGGDEHAMTSVNALHDLYERARDPHTRLLLLLQAPASAASMIPGTSGASGGIETLVAAPAPSTAAGVFDAEQRIDRTTAALGWLEAGGDEQELIDATNRQVIQNHSEWHGIKVPVAQHEMALAASPGFSRLLRAAASSAYSRGAGVWARYDEALALTSGLP